MSSDAKNPHPIYQYFTERHVIESGTSVRKYRCNSEDCFGVIKWIGSPTNLSNHLQKHSALFRKYQAETSNNKRKAPDSGPAESQNLKRPELQTNSILTMFNAAKNTNIHDSMALAFMMNGWSVRAADCKYFGEFLDKLRREKFATLPNRHVLRSSMIRQHLSLKEQLITRLKHNNCAASLLLDGWTNVNKVKVTNLLLVSRGTAYYWCSISNKDSINNAEWLYNAIKPEMEAILDYGIPIVSYVADNEAVMTATHNKLLVDYPFLVRVPCAAHTIQLAVKKILNDSSFCTVIEDVIQLINLFITNKVQRLLLHNAQPRKSCLKLIRPCATRWSYTLIAIKRLLKLRNYIDQSLEEGKQPSKPVEFWGKLNDLVTILTPFSVATDIIQQDSATLYDVGIQFKLLQDHANSLKQKQPNISLHIQACILNEWNSHINQSATIAAAILSAAPNISSLYQSEHIIAAQEYIIEWGVKFLLFYNYSSAANVKQEITSQFVEFTSGTDRFQGFQSRIDSTRVIVQKGDAFIETIKPINVWQSFRIGALELSSVAIAILSICASEAAVERSFSIQDRIHSKTRNRSKEDLVEAQVFVKFNTEALNNTNKSSKIDEIEINNDCDSANIVELSFINDEKHQFNPILNQQNVEMDVEADQEEQEEAEQSEPEDAMEEEEAKQLLDPSPAAVVRDPRAIATPEEVRAFVLRYIEENHLTKATRLFGDKENALANAACLNNPCVITNIVDLKKLIKSLAPPVL